MRARTPEFIKSRRTAPKSVSDPIDSSSPDRLADMQLRSCQ